MRMHSRCAVKASGSRTATAYGGRCADSSLEEEKLRRQYAENALTDTSDTVYSGAFDSAGELTMNDAMTAEIKTEESSKEALELVELGSVSEETKGGWIGDWP